jgi:membrane protease YdiL (CAAX protease family)
MQEPLLHSELTTSTAVQKRHIAPLWHTMLFVGILLGWSALNWKTKHAVPSGHHLPLYFFTLLWEWFLLAIAVVGLRNRKALLRNWIGEGWHGATTLLHDLGAAAIFWLVAITVLNIAAILLKHAGLNPNEARETVTKIAPHGRLEILLWTALSITAGLCEEIIFRGYLQQQFASLAGKLWIGVVLSALVFGAAHAYEGLAAMLVLALYGALFGVLAVLRRNLRAGMMAHAWHDAFTGIALTLLHHAGKF